MFGYRNYIISNTSNYVSSPNYGPYDSQYPSIVSNLNNGNLNLTFAHEADSNNIVGNSGIDIDEDTLDDDDDDDGNEVRNVEIVNSIVKPPNTEKPSFNRLRKG